MDEHMSALLAFATRHYPRHRTIFAIAVPALTVLMLLAGWTWLFWPIMAWVFIFAVQFLVVKSLTVQDDWVDERTSDTVEGAYDLDHIMRIRQSYDDKSAANERRSDKTAEQDTDDR
jgi:hypothetical protein